MACRILAAEGQEHYCLGHVSARDGTDLVVKAAGRALGDVTADDVARVALDGTNRSGLLRLHDETPLHQAIYRHRPEVGAIVHTHSAWAQAATMLDIPDATYSQDGVPFAGRLARYLDTRLVNDAERADALAEALGTGSGVLLRNHGVVTVGSSVEEATVLALMLDRALRTWLLAAAVGTPVPMPAEAVAEFSAAFDANRGQRIDDVWALVAHRHGSRRTDCGTSLHEKEHHHE